MSVNLGTAYAELKVNSQGFIAGMTEAQASLNKFKSQASLVSSGLQGIGGAMTKVGSTLTKTVTTPIVGLGAAAVKTGMDFDASMSKVAAISGATGEEFEALRNKAREMGSTTKFTASESAEAMNYMAMAGWKTQEMLDGLEGIMNLAAASGEDLGTTSDIVTDALTAFGMSAKDSSHFADVLAASAANSNTNVAMLGESFKYIAPVAGAMKYNVEDVAVALGLMANNGVKASMGGTALRNILTNLAKPTDQVATAMEELGISLQDDEGNMKSLNELMVDLRKAFGQTNISAEEYQEELDNLNKLHEDGVLTTSKYEKELERLNKRCFNNADANKAMYAATIAGKHGMSGLLAIVNSTEEDFRKLNDAIYSASEGEGMAAKQAAIMMDNLQGKLTILKSAIQEIAIQIYEVILPHLDSLIEKFQTFVNWFSKLDKAQKEQIVKWAAIAAAVGPVLLVFGKLLTSMGSLISVGFKIASWASQAASAFGIISSSAGGASAGLGAIASAAGPVLAVVAAVVALGVALKKLYDQGGQFTEAVNRLKETIGNDIKNSIDAAKQAFENFKAAMEPVIETIKNNFNFEAVDGAIAKLTDAFGRLYESLKPVVSFLMDTLVATVGPLLVATISTIMGAVDGVVNALDPLINYIADIVNIATDAINVIVGLIEGLVTGDFTKLIDASGSLMTNIQNLVSNGLSVITSLISGFFSGFGATLSGFTGITLNDVANFLTNLWNTISLFFTDTIPQAFDVFVNEIIPNVIESVGQWFDQLPYRIGYAIGSALETLNQWGNNLLNWASTTIPAFIESVITWFTQLPERIKTWLTTTMDRIVDWGNEMKRKGTEFAKIFVDNVINWIKQLPSKVQSWISQIPSKIMGYTGSMRSAGSSLMNGLWNGMKSVWDSLWSWIQDIGEKIKNFWQGILDGVKSAQAQAGQSSGGSNADGLAYVPYNGYRATLHEGERVLTRNEAASYNEGKGSGNYTFNYYSPKAIDPYQANKLFKQSVREMEEGFA